MKNFSFNNVHVTLPIKLTEKSRIWQKTYLRITMQIAYPSPDVWHILNNICKDFVAALIDRVTQYIALVCKRLDAFDIAK